MTANLIETERLILRPPVLEDFEPWTEMMSDPVAARFVGGVQPPAGVWRGLMGMAGSWALTGVSMFSVVEKETGRWIGRVGPWRPHGWPGNEVGWGLSRKAWGKGYATESASAAMDYAFDVLGWDEVIHCIDPQNAASQRVAERLGSRLLRMDRCPPPFDHEDIEIWGQAREDWKARRS
jgi:RimJ/RimL family protein N-acetyltransferase